MTAIIDNIELDKDNVDFNNAAEFVMQTDKLVYLTGKAGTGKTTFLKYIKKITDKSIVILAPTGVAAINAGGVTINSFFQIPFGPFVPNDSRLRTNAKGDENTETIYTTFKYKKEKLKIIENLELLIIDEISMVRADMLDVINQILKIFRKKPHLPFGGVQVILIGDTFQLPPIADRDQWGILSQFYKTPFFFSSKVIEQNTPIYLELKTIYRQNEKEFIDLLNKVRVNQLTQNDYQILNSKYNPTFSGNGNDYIILATHKKIVNDINLTKLNQLENKLFTFEAKVTGIFPDKSKPTDHYLKLKVGAQIMFVKNDTGKHKRYINGTIGKIKKLQDNTITVIFDDESKLEVERTVWDNIQYTYNKKKKKIEEEIIGTFEQFPIRLAWAITVHKSQGLTFEKVIADLSRAFAPGQVYVALSRCTSFSGLILKTKLNHHAIKTDPRVLEFAKNETPGTLVTEQLTTGKADFYYKKARVKFENLKIKSALGYFKKALKFRNDIQTDDFDRFIVIQGRRLFSYKLKLESLLVKFNTTNGKLNEALETLDSQQEDINEKNDEISRQNDSIQLLLDKTEESENQATDLGKQKIKLTKELSTAQNKIQQLESKLNEIKTELRSEKNINKLNSQEIQRQKDLKWYDKLIGKK